MTDRYEYLRAKRDTLMDAVEEAEYSLDMAKETLYRVAGTSAEASAQAERSRAENHYDATMQTFDAWIDSPEGEEYYQLDEEH